jgi:probable F420-dependent oxidoreductase
VSAPATADRPGPYGLTIFSGGQGSDRFRRAAALASAAEDAGFDAVWTGELYNRSATVPMAVLAQATRRVAIGSCIAYGAGRSPLVWAAEARDLDELSDGRIVLGLGNGTPTMLRNWLSVSGDAPAERMRELVTVLRALWRLDQGPVRHEGRFYPVNLAPTAPTPAPVRERLPIWTAGINPLMIAVAGAVADGLVGHPLMTVRYLDEVVRPALTAATVEAGRDPRDVAVCGTLMCAVDADEGVARRRLAFAVAQYAPAKVYERIFALHGWGAAQQAIRAAARAGDPDAMVAALPQDALDAFGVAATPDRLPALVAERARHVDHLNVVVPVWGMDGDASESATRALLEAMRPALRRTSPDLSPDLVPGGHR